MSEVEKVHRWRLCPLGEHWRRTHPLHVKPSIKNPDGITTRHGHCVKNPTRKDQLYKDEIDEIAEAHFRKLTGAPVNDNLDYDNGNSFDAIIRGWTRYWNDVFKPKEKLDPNLIKALIATESSFIKKQDTKVPGRKIKARGLMQITDETLKILTDEKGELKDHFITLNRDDLDEPNSNICAGIRWLFTKKELASWRLKRDATWEEAVEEYKGVLAQRLSGKPYNKNIMPNFRKILMRLKNK